jgi:hypothetical protein
LEHPSGATSYRANPIYRSLRICFDDTVARPFSTKTALTTHEVGTVRLASLIVGVARKAVN